MGMHRNDHTQKTKKRGKNPKDGEKRSQRKKEQQGTASTAMSNAKILK